ncbi:ABC transporter permease [Luteolibacter sp. GHJ8]|uniref:ABC transporter permease n=1 Tax=Luteolibacter rhizosphaerae TaxID=2989719 RepID=A0ABT3GAD1_9BACT|nr:ABC transporter permease [Luteolibacter rhizosphaerae]MCW1916439.1 ABC transporter permease [Luteolibacter rhizosphaerae]
MKTVFRLAFAFFREHPLRLVLTSFATAAAATMVVWVVSGYDALLGSFDEYSELALGRYPLSVAPIQHFSQQAPGAIPSTAEKFVPAETLELLRSDPAVAAADPMWALREDVRPFVEEGGEVIPWQRMPDARLVGTGAPAPPFDLVAGRWIDPARPELMEAAMSAEAAKGMGLELGGSVMVGRGDRAVKLSVIGLVGTPEMAGWSASVAGSQLLTPSVGGLYVPTALAEKIAGTEAKISFVGVSLKPEADLTKFRFAWSPRLSTLGTPVQFQEAHDIEEALDESASADNLKLQAQTATVVSMLAALFIIFSTLNMGVSERVRQLAILRAVVLTRLQVGALVIIEGLLFGTIGFVVGIAAGKGLMALAVKSAPQLLEDGAVVGTYSILLAAACAYGGALLASLVPAFRAMRVRPIDAIAPPPGADRGGMPWKKTLAGLVLIAIYPLLARGVRLGEDAPFVVLMFLGVGAMAAGFILLSPAVVLVVDRLASPLLARVVGAPPRLLGSQVSGHLARTISTSVALTVGLGLFTGIHVWGHTMLSGFMPGTWAPDAVVGFRPQGLPFEEAEKVAAFEGVSKALPIVVEQPRLKDDLTGSALRATVVRQDNVVMVGIDPESAFGGADPLFRFEWVEGSAEDAVARLKGGQACIVPDHFLSETGLKVGDFFDMVPPERPEQPVSYAIAGVVKLPGWHWQTKPTGFRTRTHRAAALVFADYGSVASDFGFRNASHVWFDYDASRTNPDHLAASARELYRASLGREVGIETARNDEPYIVLRTIDDIRALVHGHATAWLWVLSRLPLVVLVITSVGVLNALMASVQSRRWEMGVLRSIGFTRGTLVRLVIAEGLLIGLVAGAVSLAFGILAGWCGAGMSGYLSFFGGMPSELVIPWREVLGGVVAVLVLTAIAAIWPAVKIGRARPLELLQQGRGSF